MSETPEIPEKTDIPTTSDIPTRSDTVETSDAVEITDPLENRESITTLVAEIARLTRTYRRIAIAISTSSGLGCTEFGILWHLKQQEDSAASTAVSTAAEPHTSTGGIRINDIATILHLSQSVISRQVAGLEERGLTSRTPDPQDARATLITLSDKGRNTLADVMKQHSIFTKEALKEWSDNDIEHAAHLLERLSIDMRDKLLHQPTLRADEGGKEQ